MGTLYPLCRKGHELTPSNVRREYSPSHKFKLRLRCKACERERHHRAYYENALERARRLAYSHWFKFGHPKGKSWGEIREEIERSFADGSAQEVPLRQRSRTDRRQHNA